MNQATIKKRNANRPGLKVKKDSIGRREVEVGEIIPEMAKQMEALLLECINQNTHRREIYWILYTADWYSGGTELRDSCTPFEVCPPKMLNTICWKIDNKRGSMTEEWVLPKDAPSEASEIIETSGVVDENIIRAATSMPVLYD